MKCSRSGCDQSAAHSYVWRGTPERVYVCKACFAIAWRIADAMGFWLGDVREEPADSAAEEKKP